jgi:hypothetical protein
MMALYALKRERLSPHRIVVNAGLEYRPRLWVIEMSSLNLGGDQLIDPARHDGAAQYLELDISHLCQTSYERH